MVWVMSFRGDLERDFNRVEHLTMLFDGGPLLSV